MTLPKLLPLSDDTLRMLLRPRPSPCLSLVLPTHLPPNGEGDPVVLRHLADRAGESLSALRGHHDTERLLAPWRTLETDPSFWKGDLEGFAGFASDGEAWIVPLEGIVTPSVRVGSRFHTLPLVRRLASTERCRVVIVTSRSVRVCDATGDGEGEASLAPVPLRDEHGRDLADGVVSRGEVVELVREEPHRVMHGMGAIGHSVHGGVGSRAEGIDEDTRRFLHDAAAIVTAAPHLPRGGWVFVGLPRVVAGLTAGFHRNHTPQERISIDPHLLPGKELAHRVGEVLRLARRRRARMLCDAFHDSRAQGRGSSDFIEAARAAVGGRIATLLLEDGREEPGRINPRTGSIEFPTEEDGTWGACPGTSDDLYGGLADLVLGHGGDVVVLPTDLMPTHTGIAALYRWGEQSPPPSGKGGPGGHR